MKERGEFLSLLANAHQHAKLIADFLNKQGYCVRVLPHTVTPDEEHRFEHSDQGDLEIRQRIELKHWPSIDFQSVNDVRWKNVIIDAAARYEQPQRTSLYAYMILNKSLTGYLLIPVWTQRHWFKEEKHDTREDKDRVFLFCPKQFVQFHRLRKM